MVLVTGGTGFLGSHLIYHLLQEGYNVRALKRPGSNFEIISRVFSFYRSSYSEMKSHIDWVNADLNDIYQLEDSLDGVKDVYHVAALVSFHQSDQRVMHQVNVNGTANIVNISLRKNIRKFCHVSSIAALGRAEHNNIIDETALWKSSKNNSNYAISKYGAEKEVWRGIEEGLNAVIVNPSIILGPGEVNSGSTRLISTVEKGLKFYTPGTNGFVDVRDVAKIMILLMQSNISAERYVVSSENVSYKLLFQYIAGSLNKPFPKYQAGRWLSEIAWRYEYLKFLLSGEKPLVTKETARTACNTYIYSGKKLIDVLGFKYLTIEKSIGDSCNFYKGKDTQA